MGTKDILAMSQKERQRFYLLEMVIKVALSFKPPALEFQRPAVLRNCHL